MFMQVDIDLSEKAQHYLNSASRIRRVSVSRLMRRLIMRIAEDELVLAILDDDSKPCPRLPGEDGTSKHRPLRIVKCP